MSDSKVLVPQESKPTNPLPAVTAERLMIQGDLKSLTTEQKLTYYVKLCESLGLNPMTRPFSYLLLNGKLVLYATRDCTEQLRKLYKISVSFLSRGLLPGNQVYEVVVEAKDYSGRVDQATGAVAWPKGADEQANAVMKAETKAKRRVTLSICGLGLMDETEIETVRGAKKVSWEQVSEVTEGVTAEEVEDLARQKGVDLGRIFFEANLPARLSDLRKDQLFILRQKLRHLPDPEPLGAE